MNICSSNTIQESCSILKWHGKVVVNNWSIHCIFLIKCSFKYFTHASLFICIYYFYNEPFTINNFWQIVHNTMYWMHSNIYYILIHISQYVLLNVIHQQMCFHICWWITFYYFITTALLVGNLCKFCMVRKFCSRVYWIFLLQTVVQWAFNYLRI